MRQLFCYSHTPQTIATTVTVQPQINLANDSDFELLEIRATIYKAAAFDGTVLLQLQEANGNNYSNVAVNLLSFAAVQINNWSGYPIRLPVTSRFAANTTINVQLTNNNAADVVVQLQFWGYKVDKAPQPGV